MSGYNKKKNKIDLHARLRGVIPFYVWRVLFKPKQYSPEVFYAWIYNYCIAFYFFRCFHGFP